MRKAWIAYGVFLILVLMNVYFQFVLTDKLVKDIALGFTIIYFFTMAVAIKVIDDNKRTDEENKELHQKKGKYIDRMIILYITHSLLRHIFKNNVLNHFTTFMIGFYAFVLMTQYLIWRQFHWNKK